MADIGIVIDVFPSKKTSMMKSGIVKLKNDQVREFSGIFYPHEKRKLKKGVKVKGHLSGKVLRNTRLLK